MLQLIQTVTQKQMLFLILLHVLLLTCDIALFLVLFSVLLYASHQHQAEFEEDKAQCFISAVSSANSSA